MGKEKAKAKVVDIRPVHRPLAHGKREEVAVQMGVYGKSAPDAYRTVFGLAPNEVVPSTVYEWAAREDVKGRIAGLRAEKARRRWSASSSRRTR